MNPTRLTSQALKRSARGAKYTTDGTAAKLRIQIGGGGFGFGGGTPIVGSIPGYGGGTSTPRPQGITGVGKAGWPGQSNITSGQAGQIGGVLCDLITDPTLKALCLAGANLIGGGGGGGGGNGGTPSFTGCPSGKIEVAGRCVDPSAAPPGGRPFVTAGPMQAVQGAFGMPAIVPNYETREVRECPDGMVLGKDDLCYPKQVLPRRSKYRKWRPGRKPMFTGGDLKAIRRAERLKGKAKDLAKDLGYKVTNR